MQRAAGVASTLVSVVVSFPLIVIGLKPQERVLDPASERRSARLIPALAELPCIDLLPVRTTDEMPRVRVYLARNDTLAGKLVAAGLSETETAEVIEAAKSVLDPRQLRVGTILDLTFDRAGSMTLLAVERSGEPMVRVVREGGALHASLDRLPLSTTVQSAAGQIRGSLFQSVESLGESPDLAISLSKLFQWQVDLARELQPGDRFGMVFERQERDGVFVGYGRILAATLENEGREHTAILFPGEDGRDAYWSAEGVNQRRTFLRSPVAFTRVSSPFSKNRLHPVLGKRRPHWGVDLAAPAGTPVVAAGDGKVTFAGWAGAFGRSVSLSHGTKDVTKYGHLQAIAAGIKPGRTVTQGQVIGYVGSTGLSSGPHLDFRFERDGAYVDPLTMMERGETVRLSGAARSDFESVKSKLMTVLKELPPGQKRVLPAKSEPVTLAAATGTAG